MTSVPPPLPLEQPTPPDDLTNDNPLNADVDEDDIFSSSSTTTMNPLFKKMNRMSLKSESPPATEPAPEPAKEQEEQQTAPPSRPVLDPSKKYGKEDFEFFRQLGEGAYARVVLAILKETGDEYAAKIVDKKLILRERKIDTIKNERQVLMMLKHPNVVELMCTFADDDSLYFILELAQGGELFQKISDNGPTTLEAAKFYTAEIVNALEYCHSLGIIHRDLKPENILLSGEGHVKLTDFGTAKVLDHPGGHATTFCGTAEYVSPEVLQGASASAASDLWALGCVLFQLLAGHPPFQAPSEYLIFQKVLQVDFEFPANFPPVAKDLVKALMQKDVSDRLGVGENGYAKLKAHPFFEGIKFGSMHSTKPPPLHEPKDKPEESLSATASEKEGDDDSKWDKFLVDNERVVYTAVVYKKRKFTTKKRQLILTDFPRLFYVDTSTMEWKGEIPWIREMSMSVKDMKNRHFVISVPGRDYILEDPGNNADKWCDAIMNQLELQRSRS